MADPREETEVTEHPLANYPKPPPRGEDLPYDDGEPMETAKHRDQMNMLIDTLKDAQDDPERLFVGGNMFVYYSELQAKQNDFRGPDVFVVIGRPYHDRRSWVAWEEDGRLPDIVIELLSPSTEKTDRGEKFRIYRDIMKVSRYYLYDPLTYVFDGYALKDGAYVPIEPTADGRLECTPLGLELGIRPTRDIDGMRDMLRWFDADGQPLPTGWEMAQAAQRRLHNARQQTQDAEAEARDAKAKAQDAEAEARDAKAEARHAEAKAQDAEARRAEAEAQRAEAEAQRAEAEAQRADAEAQRADAEARAEALAQRIAELEGKGA